MEESGIITEIERYSIHDGPGIRTVVFLKGCPIQCKWCCNPETHASYIEMGYFKDQCFNSGRCIKACPYGAITLNQEIGITIDRAICQRYCYKNIEDFPCSQVCYSGARRNIGIRMTVQEILKEVEKDRQLYERSNGGVTLSGGEVSSQPQFASTLLKTLSNRWIHTAIETCGVGRYSFYDQIAPNLNFAFFDIKSMFNEKHEEWTKASNTQILRNAITLYELSMKYGFSMVIRTPVIPGFNDTDDDIKEIAKFIANNLSGIEGIELLPYHKLGRGKYQSIGKEYELKHLEPPSQERMKYLEGLVKDIGVKILHF